MNGACAAWEPELGKEIFPSSGDGACAATTEATTER
jgi:hypothetical protein